MNPHTGSDYMSFSRAGFSAAFATEADLMANDGTYNPFPHTVADRIDLANGEFSFDVSRSVVDVAYLDRIGNADRDGFGLELGIQHMMEFSKLAVGFVVEQAGWDTD